MRQRNRSMRPPRTAKGCSRAKTQMPKTPPTAAKDPAAKLRTVSDLPPAMKEPASFLVRRGANSRSAANPVPSMESARTVTFAK